MSTPSALAARCEAAAGPDRELDAEICFGCEPRRDIYFGHTVGALRANNSYADIGRFSHDLPLYTSSLDAAMTLVPKEMGRQLRFYPGDTAEALIWGSGDFDPHYTADAATPALALCAAALHAQAMSARRAETEGLRAKPASAVGGNADAPEQ